METFDEATKDDFGPGQWRKPNSDEKRHPNLKFKAVVICPECKCERAIADRHLIDVFGVVTPSMICKSGSHNCFYHEFIVLEGWN